jgi:hypothetical protein
MDESNAQGVTGGMEAGGLIGRTVVDVELYGQTEGGEESPKAEAQGREVFMEIIAALGNESRKMVDESAKQGSAIGAGTAHVDVGAVMKIADHELEGRLGFDAAKGLLPKPVEPASRSAKAVEMPVQGGTSDVAFFDRFLALQDVDDCLGGTVGLFAT